MRLIVTVGGTHQSSKFTLVDCLYMPRKFPAIYTVLHHTIIMHALILIRFFRRYHMR